MTVAHYGASPGAWAHWDVVLGVGEDLLPVVADPRTKLSPASGLKSLGKVPSRLNKRGEAAGFANWTTHRATPEELAAWEKDPRLGLCLQTRVIRALDCDITDPALAKEIYDEIHATLGLALPARRRSNSPKFLLTFALQGTYPKRILTTAAGAIEFLGTGNQAVIDSTHTSGVRYFWDGGFPSSIPELIPEAFEALWARLVARFATDGSTTGKVSTKAATLSAAVENDPIAQEILALGATIDRDGKLRLPCPFADGHTAGGDDSIIYYPRATGGYANGNVRCLHASCDDRTQHDFLEALGLAPDPRDEFSAVAETPSVAEKAAIVAEKAARFTPIPDADFKAGKPPGWLIKNVIPRAEVGVIYGASGAGKSFEALDMAGAIARGLPWCGKTTHTGIVVYIAAEGASGFRNRLNAYCQKNEIESMGIYVIAGAPNFMEAKDVVDLKNAILALGLHIDLIIVDTLAQVSAGANENSGEDMGRVLGHCGKLNARTGAMVLLIHHSGKDPSKGGRGWSGIKGALNVEIEVTREERNRTTTITKMRDGGGEGDKYGFVLGIVPIGVDEDGDAVTSCVVEHGAVVPPRDRTKPLTKMEKNILQAHASVYSELSGWPHIDTVAEALMPLSGQRIDNARVSIRSAKVVTVNEGLVEVIGVQG